MDVGVEFENYRILEHIGRGGMADVWSARDKRLSRTVAIKTIARDLSNDTNPIQLFEKEAQTIAALEHPHILPVYGFGEYEGQLFIAMRYVSGGSLESLLERSPLSLEETLRVSRAVGQALDYAHTNKVIHLDLKPSNILLDSYQSPYLADFGLATMLGPEGRAANPGSGTLLYMAPEQLTSEVLDHRVDIYSFAILIFHMMTGQLPFDAAMPLALKQLQMSENIPEVQSVLPGLPSALNTVLQKGTSLNPEQRQASLETLIQDLEKIIQPNSISLQNLQRQTGQPAATPTLPLNDLLSNPIDHLISRPKQAMPSDSTQIILDDQHDIDLISRVPRVKQESLSDSTQIDLLDNLISRPNVPIQAQPVQPTELKIDVSDLSPALEVTPPEAVKREEVDIYQRARRIYAQGKGRFPLGITDYILIADYYAEAEKHQLELDDAGLQMLLRGALEYDHEIEFWWSKLSLENQRWTALHTIRSESAPARIRGLQKLETIEDTQPPHIAERVAQTLQVETVPAVERAALRVLAQRGSTTVKADVDDHKHLWRTTAFSPEIDLLIAQKALDFDEPITAELASRTIGQIYSVTAVQEILEQRREGNKHALKALAVIRDQALSLPPEVAPTERFYAWIANTYRRLTSHPLETMWRFLWATIGGTFAMATYVWIAFTNVPGAFLLTAQVWGRAVSIGLSFGVLIGILVLIAGEIPERLIGFWKWWARLLWSVSAGLILGTLSWGVFSYLILELDPEWNVMLLGGVGTAVAFGITSLVRLSGWLKVFIATMGIGAPIVIAWDMYNQSTLPVPIMYLFDYVQHWVIPFFILIGLGAHFQALWHDLKALRARFTRS